MTVLQTLKRSRNSAQHIYNCQQHHKQSRCRTPPIDDSELFSHKLKMDCFLCKGRDRCQIWKYKRTCGRVIHNSLKFWRNIPYLQSKHGINWICNSMERLHTRKYLHLHHIPSTQTQTKPIKSMNLGDKFPSISFNTATRLARPSHTSSLLESPLTSFIASWHWIDWEHTP